MANINDFHKRLAKVEQQVSTAVAGDIGVQILQARVKPMRPRRTREFLQAHAASPGLIGSMARADLRTGRVGNSVAPIDPEVELPQAMGEFHADPMGFVMWAFDWGTEPALRVVQLPDTYATFFDSEFGPDKWAADVLEDIGRQVTERAFDGSAPVAAVRVAISSGHGIGKSFLTAMLALWIMSTRPNSRGIVTASTAPQLESKTWATIAAWTKRCMTRDWWDVSTGRGSMKMVNKERPEAWNCFAQTADATRAESFAGLHAADASAFYLVDESSGVPDSIYEVCQGGLTDGEPFLIAAGNPTRNTGWFHGAFHGQKHRWTTYQIDSRDVAITNKDLLQGWVDDFGLDSDFVKVRVRGVFPSASSLQFISRGDVDNAMTRETPNSRDEAVIVSVDVARFGSDESVIFTRQGRDGRAWPPIRLRQVDTMTLAARVGEHANFLRSAGHFVLIAVDGGGVGGGVIDRLRSVGYDVTEVQFGSRAMDPKRYGNRRAEIWGEMRDWLKVGALPKDEELAMDLTGVEYSFNSSDQIMLERKEAMKARGLSSPDLADALAIGFAVTPALPGEDSIPYGSYNERDRLAVLNWSPLEHMERF